MDRSTKQKINKEMQTLDDTVDQLDLIDIYRTFQHCTEDASKFSKTRKRNKQYNNRKQKAQTL